MPIFLAKTPFTTLGLRMIMLSLLDGETHAFILAQISFYHTRFVSDTAIYFDW
jgi:hypothetical protein